MSSICFLKVETSIIKGIVLLTWLQINIFAINSNLSNNLILKNDNLQLKSGFGAAQFKKIDKIHVQGEKNL